MMYDILKFFLYACSLNFSVLTFSFSFYVFIQALASTVQPDPTAPHYKYHDDPYLTPLSNVGKRSFALSKESGRKAAQWIRAQNSELFQHKVAYPAVQVVCCVLSL
jgi:hypothetical protein